MILVVDVAKRRMTRIDVRVGSVSVNSILSGRLFLDIENTAMALRGITVNSPITTANSGKTKPGSTSASRADKTNITTQAVTVKSENARHRLR